MSHYTDVDELAGILASQLTMEGTRAETLAAARLALRALADYARAHERQAMIDALAAAREPASAGPAGCGHQWHAWYRAGSTWQRVCSACGAMEESAHAPALSDIPF